MPLFFNAAMMLAAATQAPPPPLEPSGRWSLDASSSSCVASRSFGSGQVDVSIASPPLQKQLMVTVAMPDVIRAHAGDTLTLVFGPRGERVDGKALPVAPHDGGKSVFGFVVDTGILPRREFETVGLEIRSKMRLLVRTGPMTAIAQAVDRCARDVLASYGRDAEQNSAVSKPATLPEIWKVLSPANYPPEALRQRAEGRLGALMHIGADGRVERCAAVESSGNKALDQGTCVLLLRKARFSPAELGQRTRAGRHAAPLNSQPSRADNLQSRAQRPLVSAKRQAPRNARKAPAAR